MAAICKAVADPLRLDIVRLLSRDSYGVQELAYIFDMPQPGMSHHLKVLTSAGLLSSRRQGNSIFYRRRLLGESDDFADFIKNLYQSVDTLTVGDDVVARVEQVQQERATLSAEFFRKHADRFRDEQGQPCELNQYLPSLVDMLNVLEAKRTSRVLEVGPGHGELLKELGKRYGEIVALDESEQMLAVAKENLARHKKIQFVQGSLEEFEKGDQGHFELVVLNMVLHHMPSPATAFQQLFRLIVPGGGLIIADLCAHDQEWTKDSCGDLWQGFDPEELSAWAQAAGLVEVQSQFLGLKNGFQIQLGLFKRDIA